MDTIILNGKEYGTNKMKEISPTLKKIRYYEKLIDNLSIKQTKLMKEYCKELEALTSLVLRHCVRLHKTINK